MSEQSGLGQVLGLVRRAPAIKRRLGRAVWVAVLGSASAVAGFVCVGFAVGAIVGGADELTPVLWWSGGALLGLVGGFLLRLLAEHLAHEASFEFEVILRRMLADGLARMPLGEVQRLGSGRIKKIVHDDVKALHNVVADALPFVGSGIAQPIAAMLALGIVSWKLLLVVLLMVPIAAFAMSLMTKDYAEQRNRYNQASEDVNAALVEFVQGMPVVRTFDDGSTSFRRFGDRVDAFTEAVAAWSATSRSAGLLTRLFVVPLPTLLLVAAAGVPMLAAGWISVPELTIALLIGAMPIEAVAPLMHLTNYINDAKAGAVRLTELLEMPGLPEPVAPKLPADASIRLDGVSFGYDADRLVLRDVDLEIPAGTVCALVGPSGGGKSTIARLIPRFYDVTAGAVRIGGVDVREMESAEVLRQVALVFQDPFLVQGTIAENIRLAKPDATDDEVRAAAEAAAAHEFIVGELPDGYDTQVGERGGRLSGGQRQRITIARAMLSGAPIVVLDEATAFADPENEALIQNAVARLTRGRTVLIIAHRLSTIVDVDQIVVVDNGLIAERGRHADLVGAGGRYASLWARHEQASRWGLSATQVQEATR
ncbi:ABC transporter ATP-binding protein [Kribbella sandramycini]|uniref:ABC transporter ATP-binding protein n=1 Tax=Kribbella sandramycini TaxID=60450 RepID=A0A7Y4KYZ0_9ACTN|nr:ABC transporter ATP-binding protein [Kribbella sandramycini]MBB6569656.1 ATP-binding cassette subfamily B protein [Kribbella sandramycini]NOL40512.1 ABC transporter ATP-binding protein [Kribbella sandramycini]